jgi:hypothetical protein
MVFAYFRGSINVTKTTKRKKGTQSLSCTCKDNLYLNRY